MDKQEILIELKKAKKIYYKAINIDFAYWKFLEDNNILYGFCCFFNSNSCIINELEKDLLIPVQQGYYWYAYALLPEEIDNSIKQALKPRLEHLQRTINRLENELKNQPTI